MGELDATATPIIEPDPPQPRLPQIGDMVHFYSSGGLVLGNGKLGSEPVKVVAIREPTPDGTRVLDVAIEWEVEHEPCLPAPAHLYSSINKLRGFWTIIGEDGYPVLDPAAEPKPTVSASDVALYTPDETGVDVAVPAQVIDDHAGCSVACDLLTLVTTERQIVPNCHQGRGDRQWDWEPAEPAGADEAG
jgi:hypothetical protein